MKLVASPFQQTNVDTLSVIEALEGSWFQYFGQPSNIRCDLEGAFRGTDLAAFCAERGIELLHVLAEHHQVTGDVERMVGELRHKIEVFLRNEEVPVRRAVYAMTTAHNHMARVGGFAPSQWAFGRQADNLDNVALHSSEGTADHAMAENLQLRLRAEKRYLELNAQAKISRAMNSKTKMSEKFMPGDLVYYRRFKVPADFPAHQTVDQPRLRISRWYGPGRVLACETRVQEEGTKRVAASTVWVISQWRLKKFHRDQLRHASERERLIAEQSPAPVMPWTFNALEALLQKGSFDDHTVDMMEKNFNKQQRKAKARAAMPVPVGGERRVQRDPATGSMDEPQVQPRELLPDELPPLPLFPDPPDAEMEEPTASTTRDPDVESVISGDRLMTDPSYLPLKRIGGAEPEPGEVTFRRQRRQREMEDRPLHVKKQELEAAAFWCHDEAHDLVYGVEIPMPADEKSWRKILKDPSKFAAKSVQKGAEVSWGRLDPEQRKAMAAAKNVEVEQWVKEEVCKRYKGVIPAGRMMKMRWVPTLKSTDSPTTAKCKARIVVLGFTDPDIESLQTSAPTLTRRSRQLS